MNTEKIGAVLSYIKGGEEKFEKEVTCPDK